MYTSFDAEYGHWVFYIPPGGISVCYMLIVDVDAVKYDGTPGYDTAEKY